MKTLITLTISFYFFIVCFAGQSPVRQSKVFYSHRQYDTIYESDQHQLGIINRVRDRLNLSEINSNQLDSLSQ